MIKSLRDGIESLAEQVALIAQTQASIMSRLDGAESMQKSLSQGTLALMERLEEVFSKTPQSRKGVVTQYEANLAMAKSQIGGGTAAASGAMLKPFTQERLDKMKDVLIKAVGDKTIDVLTSMKWESQMNKSIGKAAFEFSPDFVAFMRQQLTA
jgi:hypothetical protein